MFSFEKIKNDDVKEFESLFRFFYRDLVDFSLYYVADRQIAESIVQDVFVNIWKGRNKITLKSSIKVYLYSATKKECLRYLRDIKIHSKYVFNLSIEHETATSFDDPVCSEEIRKACNSAIKELPDKGKLIFCMNRFDELTYNEISNILGISIKTVETHMSRALKYLRKQLSHLLFF